MSLVVKEVLRKCRFSAFAIIRPNIHERVKITQSWQLHLKLGCISPLLPCAQMAFSETVCLKPPVKDLPEQSDLLPFPIPFCFFKVAFHTRRMNTRLFQHGEATAEKGRENKFFKSLEVSVLCLSPHSSHALALGDEACPRAKLPLKAQSCEWCEPVLPGTTSPTVWPPARWANDVGEHKHQGLWPGQWKERGFFFHFTLVVFLKVVNKTK